MTYHKKSYPHRPWTTTLNLANGNARLVTLAPGLRPERRFAPLVRGLLDLASKNKQTFHFYVRCRTE